MANLAQRLITPQNVQAERAVLTCIFVDPSLIYEAQIKPDWFYKPENKEVYLAVQSLIIANKPIDFLNIKDELRVRGKLDEIGGEEFLNNIADDEFVPANFESYVSLIRDAYSLRNIAELGSKCIDVAYNPNIKVQMARESIYSAFNTLLDDEDVSKTYKLADLVKDEFVDLKFRIENPDKVGIPTGFRDYDILTGGLHGTNLNIIAGRPGMGKSAILFKLYLNLAEQGVPCLLWEFEMSRSEVIQRMASIKSGVNVTKISTGRLSQEEYNAVSKALKTIKDLPIFVETDVTANIYDVMLKTHRMKIKHGIKVLGIDHVGLMTQSPDNLTLEIGHISRSLKKLAMELNITIFLLSQLNRNLESRPDKRPILSDLRQSGDLEQDANQVIFLYRDEIYNKTDNNRGIAEVMLAKHRSGPIGVFNMIFKTETTDFINFGGN